jgi:hypothetical protein
MRGVVALDPKRSPSRKNLTLPFSVGIKKSKFNRVGLIETVLLFTPGSVDIVGMLDGINLS